MELDALDIGHLRVFNALLENRSVSATGQRLGLPQSTISRKLAALRDYFDDDLFVRTKAGMEPTAAALALADPVSTMLSLHRKCMLRQEEAFDPQPMTRDFRIAALEIERQLMIPSLYAWSSTIAPNVTFKAVPLGTSPAADLEAGRVDLVVGALYDCDSRVHELVLSENPYVCAVRADSPLLDAPLTLERFRAARHAVVRLGNGAHLHHEVVDALLGDCPSRNIVEIADSFTAAALLLHASDRILTIPAGVAGLFRQQLSLEFMEPPIKLPTARLRMYWHHRFDRDPASMWLRDGVRTLVASNAMFEWPLYPQARTPQTAAGRHDASPHRVQ